MIGKIILFLAVFISECFHSLLGMIILTVILSAIGLSPIAGILLLISLPCLISSSFEKAYEFTKEKDLSNPFD